VQESLPDGRAPNTDWKKRMNSTSSDNTLDNADELILSDFSLARIEEMLQSSTNARIRSFATKSNITLKSSAKVEMVRQIIKQLRKNAGISYPVFDKFFPSFNKVYAD
jgi:hypothetical protein